MRRLAVDNLTAGQILARAIYNERGDVLLNAGVEITDRFIALLRARHVTTILVREPGEDDTTTEDIISERVRVAALANINKVFEVAVKATSDLQGRSVSQVSGVLQSEDRRASMADVVHYQRLYRVVESIIDEVLVADTLPGLTSLKTHDNYTFCHSVDVAVTALVLGKKLFLSRDQLKVLGVGCVLHDIGKSLVPSNVLNKPGRLTSEELALIKAHPMLGFDLLRAQMPEEVLPKHVAFQHHERQDGSGYPRGLRGSNRVARDDREKFASGRMMLLAEIAAVADVYDALASDRPYRPALPAEVIVTAMRSMTGHHLNDEVVDAFLNVLPLYPVGVDFVVTEGRMAGFRGVVVSTNRRAVNRPRIRLTHDARGVQLSPPIDLDLADEPETMITCVIDEVPVPV